ncbi:MAG: hypothetical protein BRD37_07170 [Bacteroidetes bacterium QH_8_67_23]|nr:MAG: hypothetical protein BRD37_07170 [Bacteroidetes bacterium QH_8_67_23]
MAAPEGALSRKEADPEAAPPSIPPLRAGDRLARPEFERRYEAMPHLEKAELIDGRVYMPSPVGHQSHGKPHNHLNGWLAVYAAATPGVEASSDATVRLDLDDEPQPDVLLRVTDACGGASQSTDDDYLAGAPELAAEVAASTASYDLHEKKGAYRALEPSDDGLLESRVFPGLRLDVAALLGGDLAAVLETARDGTETEAHAAFIQHLDAQREA